MRQMRDTIALVTTALLVACSSASDKQHRSSPPLSQHSSAPSSPARSSNQVAQSGPCPVTTRWSTARSADLGPGIGDRYLLGPGPVFPGAYTPLRRWSRDRVFEMLEPRHPDTAMPSGWLGEKVLWKVSRDYRGPVVITGREIGGPGRMRFSDGQAVSRALGFHAGDGWPSEVFVPHAGCYAWHIRGRGFGYRLVFRVVCVSGPGLRRCA
jgi:hypothetical protein